MSFEPSAGKSSSTSPTAQREHSGEPESTSPSSRDAGERVLRDYSIAYQSRQASLIGRTEALTGKAKFGIFGDGKEVPQLAMARAFRDGDFRSGYYRDQTFMMAVGALTVEEFFAQLYANPDPAAEPCSSGRQMNAHFATHFLHPDGTYRSLTSGPNSSADVSPTASQMPRLLGLAYASRLFRSLPGLAEYEHLSKGGNEIAFGTIGDASCAEGLFWETINAAGVIQAPLVMSVWDDGYGISVPSKYQITKANISKVLSGFQIEHGHGHGSDNRRSGLEIFTVDGWDYPALCETYLAAADLVRREHLPALIHVRGLTQPQGHSTSGSHERYKSPERLEWEAEHDCLTRMRAWVLEQGYASDEDLERREKEDRQRVVEAKMRAWKEFRRPIDDELKTFVSLATDVAEAAGGEVKQRIEEVNQDLLRKQNPNRRDIAAAAVEAMLAARQAPSPARDHLSAWKQAQADENYRRYSSNLYLESGTSALEVPEVAPAYPDEPTELRGFEIMNACFEAILERDPRVVAFGEDVGRLGDVNQGFSGLQEKFSESRVSDTGIREATIIGQAIGMAMRGLRPIAEIQYLDYILYAVQVLSDDLSTLTYRTDGRQKAPLIVRTRGHRLEGIWHAGSPMGALIHLLRGMVICVPRNMTQAAGFYNTLLASDDPGLVVEVLNGYRRREPLPTNIAEMTTPVGVPEVIREGSDVTVVTYGACCPIALEAAELLAETGIDIEVIDVRTLLPFDVEGHILESLKKTSRVVFLDEDVPGGATGYMLREVLEVQGGYTWLDEAPLTITAKAHRPAYGSDGDYFSKPNREEVFEKIYALMHGSSPRDFPFYDTAAGDPSGTEG